MFNVAQKLFKLIELLLFSLVISIILQHRSCISSMVSSASTGTSGVCDVSGWGAGDTEPSATPFVAGCDGFAMLPVSSLSLISLE